MKLSLRPLLPVLVALSATVACATGTTGTDDEADPDAVPAEEDADSSDGETEVPVGDGDGDSTPTGTGGSMSVNLEDLPVEAPLPMIVTDFFGPSGFMGAELELPHEVDGITMDVEGCTDRPEGALGECFKITYKPQNLYPGPSLDTPEATWAGVFFQNPEENWGEARGVIVEPGATKITFNAWTESGELLVEFLSGGIGNLGTAYADTFKSNLSVTLTDDLSSSAYEISLVGMRYHNVLGGFGWVLSTDSLDEIVFYLDNVVWTK